jgi:hypothetical protein
VTDEGQGAGRARAGKPSSDPKGTIAKIFDGLVHATIVTAVGDVAVTITSGRSEPEIDTPKPITKAIVTIVDLIDGDITNVVSPELLDDTALRAFHTQQVEASLKVLPDNVRSLAELAKSLLGELR